MTDNQTGVIMKNVILTHKELQFSFFAAVVEGLRAANLTPRHYSISYGNAEASDSHFVIELWRHASTHEKMDAKVLHSYKINKGDYQMNDVRPGVTIRYIKEHCEKFVEEIAHIINLGLEEALKNAPSIPNEDKDILDFANYALKNASAIASARAKEDLQFSASMSDVNRWKEEFRPHYYGKKSEPGISTQKDQ